MISEDFPWPALGGGLIRLAKMVEAVSAVGETDLFTLYGPRHTSPALPSRLEVRKMETVQLPRHAESPLVAFGTPVSSSMGLCRSLQRGD